MKTGAVAKGEILLAKIISVLFHPLLMTTYVFILIFFTKNYISAFINEKFKWVFLTIIFSFTFILPVINAFILLKMGKIKSLEMETQKERIIPYGSAVLYYAALLYLLYHTGLPATFKIILMGAACAILFALIINNRWKISAHMIGIGGIAGAILAIMYKLQIDLELAFFVIILISGLVGYARLRLNSHTPSQVYTGFLLGFCIQFFLSFCL